MTETHTHTLELTALEPNDSETALKAVSGELVLLTGASGSGKSVWLKRLAGLEAAPAGINISLDGNSLDKQRVRMLFDRWPCIWLGQTVAEELNFGLSRQSGVQNIEKTLADWDLNGLAPDAEPGSLNRLQAVRLSLAAIYLAQPALVLLDNPTAALSESDARTLIEKIKKRAENSDTIVVVACNRWHDWQPAATQQWCLSTPHALPEFMNTTARSQA